tara:strand:+ start:7660 stop:7929 length:270 start_codon:yes stop_codon:yes gene_type:complete
MKILFVIKKENLNSFKPCTMTQAVTEVKNIDEVNEIMDSFEKQGLKVTGTYPEDKETWREWQKKSKLKTKTSTNTMVNTHQGQKEDFTN